MKAVIELDVPKWQIGQEAHIFFPDTMELWATVKEQEAAKPAVAMTEIDFLDWLACSVVLADDFETNPEFYREVICRKLVRLGMLKLEDDKYVLPEPTKKINNNRPSPGITCSDEILQSENPIFALINLEKRGGEK